MNYQAGFLKVLCTWMVILMQSLDAKHIPKKPAVGVSCRPKELTNLTRCLVEGSLISFDEANGENIGTWSPGFPELQVHQNSSASGSEVQCTLLFMSQGMEKVLEDQKRNLNPKDVSLHKKLRETISTVNLLAACLKEVLVGECASKPTPPKMPKHVFERKQWSHTLLRAAKKYLVWLEHKLEVQVSKVKGKSKILKHTVNETAHERYLEGNGYLL